MKTTSQSQQSAPGLGSRTEQWQGGTRNSRTDRTTTRPRISLERRWANRGLRTGQLLNLLRLEAPRLFELAEVVGQWVWIQFENRQPPNVTCFLSEMGFHWNNRRQTWQHPCGTRRPQLHPRDKYGSHFPADNKPL